MLSKYKIYAIFYYLFFDGMHFYTIFFQLLPDGSRVMRVMPNTPALVQCGASVYVPGNQATDEDEKLTAKLLSSVGTAERVQEYLMDPITALSGSGPAYVSLILESVISIINVPPRRARRKRFPG